MYPEVEQFIAALDAAREAETAAYNAAHAAYEAKKDAANVGGHVWSGGPCKACDFKSGPAGVEHRDAIEAAWEAFLAAQKAAWVALAESADPLVRWIAENCQGYADEAQEILRMLPASLMKLDVVASDRGWCGDWDRLRKAAEEAGVLPAASAVPAESEVSA
jgi:hypothetical protein